MKKFLIAAAAVATLAGAAGAASAQPYGGPRYDGPRYDAPRGNVGYGSNTINNKQELIRDRINRGERAGLITARESRQLRNELRDIAHQERAFRASRGLDQREFAVLNARIERLEWRVNKEVRDRQSYSQGYGYRR